MSQKSNQTLALIEWHEQRNSWPNDVMRCQWQGSLSVTWLKYVGKNLLDNPTNDINYLKSLDNRFNRPMERENSFVYLWKFRVINHVFFKVGVTNCLQNRFKTFRTLMPKSVMSNCEVHNISTVGKSHSRGKAENIELNFIVACRQFYLDNEWFDFKSETP